MLVHFCHPATRWLQAQYSRWLQLTSPQKAYTIVLGVILAVALPRLLVLLFVLLERMLVGSLLATEEVLLSLLWKGIIVVRAGATNISIVTFLMYINCIPLEGQDRRCILQRCQPQIVFFVPRVLLCQCHQSCLLAVIMLACHCARALASPCSDVTSLTS